MKQLVEFPLKDGGTVLVEIDEQVSGRQPVSKKPGEVAARANQAFEDALEKVKPAAQSIIAKLRGLNDPPDEVEVEFGIKLSAEAGAFVASAGVDAHYTITLKWQGDRAKK